MTVKLKACKDCEFCQHHERNGDCHVLDVCLASPVELFDHFEGEMVKNLFRSCSMVNHCGKCGKYKPGTMKVVLNVKMDYGHPRWGDGSKL